MGLMTALVLGGTVAAGVGAGLYMAHAVSKSGEPTPEVPPPPPTPEVEAGQVRRFQKARKGRGKTIITGDLTPETLSKKTLLGG